MGSAGGELKPEVREKVMELGREIARRGYVLITGAAPGLPHDAVLGAKSVGGMVVGISPALTLEEHVNKYHSPTSRPPSNRLPMSRWTEPLESSGMSS